MSKQLIKFKTTNKIKKNIKVSSGFKLKGIALKILSLALHHFKFERFKAFILGLHFKKLLVSPNHVRIQDK